MNFFDTINVMEEVFFLGVSSPSSIILVSGDDLLEYDPNSNVSLAGTPGGPTVRVMFISGFISVFD